MIQQKNEELGECCILSFGWFPRVWILYANISEHSAYSIIIGSVCSHCLLWWNRKIVPKHRHIKFRCQRITQKKEYNNQNMVKVWSHELGVFPSQCHLYHHRSHTDRTGNEPSSTLFKGWQSTARAMACPQYRSRIFGFSHKMLCAQETIFKKCKELKDLSETKNVNK